MDISKVVDDEGQTQTTIFFIKFLTAYLVPFLKLFKITFFFIGMVRIRSSMIYCENLGIKL